MKNRSPLLSRKKLHEHTISLAAGAGRSQFETTYHDYMQAKHELAEAAKSNRGRDVGPVFTRPDEPGKELDQSHPNPSEP